MARHLEAVQCLNLITPGRLAEALEIAYFRAGLRPFQEGYDPAVMEIVFTVPDELFPWFRMVLEGRLEKYERRSALQYHGDLSLRRS
jgi:hypothetical protein